MNQHEATFQIFIRITAKMSADLPWLIHTQKSDLNEGKGNIWLKQNYMTVWVQYAYKLQIQGRQISDLFDDFSFIRKFMLKFIHHYALEDSFKIEVLYRIILFKGNARELVFIILIKHVKEYDGDWRTNTSCFWIKPDSQQTGTSCGILTLTYKLT